MEVYHLVDGSYQLLPANDRQHYPIAPMGVELGIKEDGGVPWLRWWDDTGNLLLTGNERAVKAEAKQQLAEQKAARLAEKLRELGIDPEEIGDD